MYNFTNEKTTLNQWIHWMCSHSSLKGFSFWLSFAIPIHSHLIDLSITERSCERIRFVRDSLRTHVISQYLIGPLYNLLNNQMDGLVWYARTRSHHSIHFFFTLSRSATELGDFRVIEKKIAHAYSSVTLSHFLNHQIMNECINEWQRNTQCSFTLALTRTICVYKYV